MAWRIGGKRKNLSDLNRQFEISSSSCFHPFFGREPIEGPSAYLSKLHSHLSILQPGAGYAPHQDGHDVAIVVLDGTVETMGRVVEPYGVVFYAAGEGL
ncbi:MAG TPA: hypothetical protein VFJ49_01495 [Methyloceanibacter sp.]|nr:hypothetical protein [Methyloceanibacter sp.]